MPINWSNSTGGHNLLDLFRMIGTNTDGWFWILFLAAFWLIMVISTAFFAKEKTLLMASFITFSLSVLLWSASLIGWQFVAIALVLTAFTYWLAG